MSVDLPTDDEGRDDDQEAFLERMAEKYEGEFKGRVAELVLQSSEEVSN